MNAVDFTYRDAPFRFFPEAVDFESAAGARFRPAQLDVRPHATQTGVNFITLNIAHDCNMGCPYCFAKQGLYGGPRKMMTPDVARKAVDWLLQVSGARPDVYLRFLGGEPLMNVPVMRDTMFYATEKAAQAEKQVHFSVNTNGTYYNEEIGDLLKQFSVTISISIDGTQEAHDRHRIFRNGTGTYATVVKNVPKLLACDPNVMVNGTLTSETLDVSEYAKSFRALGIQLVRFAIVGTTEPGIAIRQEELLAHLRDQYDRLADYYMAELESGRVWYLADFYKYMPNLRQGQLRGNRCGAGTSYVNIDVDGQVHMCHRFTADRTQHVGSITQGAPAVEAGVTKVFQLTRMLPSAPSGKAAPINPVFRHRQLDGTLFFEQSKSASGGANPCHVCDIRNLCGGYCYHDGEILFGDLHGGPDGIKCEVDRHIAKITMWMLGRLGYDHPALDRLDALHLNSIQHTD
jgi:uncharacterized protein